jgi:hypothetical protein
MDANNKDDIYYDNDGDGFSNIFEINNEFIPNDAKSHPPLWWRFQVKDIRQIELPVSFMTLMDNNSNDKHSWQMQFNMPNPRRKDKTISRYLMIGNTIDIEGRKYELVDVERIITEKKREAGNLDTGDVVDKIDESRVILLEKTDNGKPDKLEMVVKKPTFSNDRRPVVADTGNVNSKKDNIWRIGDVINLGLFNRKSDIGSSLASLSKEERAKEVRSYRLVSVDTVKMSITIEDVTGKDPKTVPVGSLEPIVIPRGGMVPAKLIPKKEVERSAMDEMAADPGMTLD